MSSSPVDGNYQPRGGFCEGCLDGVDCRTCSECIRKSKHDTDCLSKQVCTKRRCQNLQDRNEDGDNNDAVARRTNVAGGESINGADRADHSVTSLSFSPLREHSDAPFRRPASLIEVPGDAEYHVRAERMNYEPNSRTSGSTAAASTSSRKRLRNEPRQTPLQAPVHFAGRSIQEKIYGVCSKCGMNEEELEDTIVLCDGPGCNQEFHLQCCIPPLSQVPKGCFYCFDCSLHGSTSLLKTYLDEVEHARESYQYLGILEPTGSNLTQARSKVTTSTIKAVSTSKVSADASLSDDTRSNGGTNNASQEKLVISATKITSAVKRRRPEFVDHLLCKDIQDAHPERSPPKTEAVISAEIVNHLGNEGVRNNTQNPCSNLSPEGVRIPSSELDAFHAEMKRNAGCTSPNDSGLVGKTIRLYCPHGNQYHNGRILLVLPSPTTLDTECLVRFHAGRDHRKTHLTRWIRLEEHSLAVATHLAWGLFSAGAFSPGQKPASSTPGKGKSCDGNFVPSMTTTDTNARPQWSRAQIWTRTSRELVNAMGLLHEDLGQIRYRSLRYEDEGVSHGLTESPVGTARPGSSDKKDLSLTESTPDSVIMSASNVQGQEWRLAQILGRGTYELLKVSTETRGIGTLRHAAVSAHVASSPRATSSSAKVPASASKAARSLHAVSNSSQREAQIALALEEAERAEQARVRHWSFALRLKNPWHIKALTLQDEFALPALDVDRENHRGLGHKRSIVIQPTPLVRPGLDRIYILSQLDPSWENCSSKDLACTLTCELVESVTAFVQNKNSQQRRAFPLTTTSTAAAIATACVSTTPPPST